MPHLPHLEVTDEMVDVYLVKLERLLRDGVNDLHDAADRLHVPYDLVCLVFNHGLLKGYWKIGLTPKEKSPEQ